MDAFAAQQEPLDVWKAALRGELPYELTVWVTDALDAGICFERYPRSGCGLVTYEVVVPARRGQGVGRGLVDAAVRDLHARGATAVFGEVVGSERVHRFQRWGAKVADCRYVQPALGPGLSRDRSLTLIVLGSDADAIDGSIVRAFVDELYDVTEGGPPDDEVAVGDRVPLVRW